MNRYDSITHSFARAPWLVEGAARSLEVCSKPRSEPMIETACLGRPLHRRYVGYDGSEEATGVCLLCFSVQAAFFYVGRPFRAGA